MGKKPLSEDLKKINHEDLIEIADKVSEKLEKTLRERNVELANSVVVLEKTEEGITAKIEVEIEDRLEGIFGAEDKAAYAIKEARKTLEEVLFGKTSRRSKKENNSISS